MSYRVEDIEGRLRSGEDSGWEFKQVEFAGDRPKRPTRSDWADTIAAFANAAGGVVVAGVSDDGDVIGLTRAQIASLDTLLVEVSTDTIKPPVRIRTHHEELSDGKLVLLAEVPESDFVHESPGGSYIRVGASKRLMGGDERLRLAQRRSQARFPWFGSPSRRVIPRSRPWPDHARVSIATRGVALGSKLVQADAPPLMFASGCFHGQPDHIAESLSNGVHGQDI